ncbi:porin [Dasania sp. GY-MA-18]|uniref:Porin n=1 Tax=Dasania phycosphaerae TaxID=2950436 RepID=A0A9J6RQZ6_9GAMM|nr:MULTISPECIES: porin [Dasania]MCR8924239.1 porin [Dasania sp. GY-MA-18]MCZ0866892.1 porin [Dasania phycosphaerae]MCZ0870396.1 porin [Dasania phycosphaerae]
MKPSNLALAIAALSGAVLATPALAENDITIYGKANLSLNQVDYETDPEDQWNLTSNASRIGVKGSVAINDELKAIYKMEYEVAIDDGDSDGDEFKQRNIYVGLQGTWGTVIGGKHDTPTKLIGKPVDRFNDLELGDIKNLLEGENRESNIVIYSSPKFAENFSASVAFIPGEDSDDSDGETNDGLADATSIALSFKNEQVYAAIANDSEVDGWDLTRLAADFTLSDKAKAGFIFQDGELSDGDVEQTGYIFSGQYTIDKIVLKAQYGMSTYDFGAIETDLTQITIGADYKINKAVKAYTYYSNIETDIETDTTYDDSVFSVGLEVKF